MFVGRVEMKCSHSGVFFFFPLSPSVILYEYIVTLGYAFEPSSFSISFSIVDVIDL